jgi:8-oxo-dGTP diphosphatase
MIKKEHNVATVMLLNENGEILLQKKDLGFKRWPGRWSMFGGGIESGETPEDAVRREITEELGLKLENLKLFKIFPYEDTDRAGKMHVYTASFVNEISDISLGEGAGFAFFAPSEIAGLRLIDHDDKIVKEYMSANY